MTNVAKVVDLQLSTKLQDPAYRRKFFWAETSARIAKQLLNLRKKRGLNQKEVAELTGTKQPAISRAEQADYQNWNLNTLRAIADALDARVRVLIEPSEDILGEYESQQDGAETTVEQFSETGVYAIDPPMTVSIINPTAASDVYFSNGMNLEFTGAKFKNFSLSCTNMARTMIGFLPTSAGYCLPSGGITHGLVEPSFNWPEDTGINTETLALRRRLEELLAILAKKNQEIALKDQEITLKDEELAFQRAQLALLRPARQPIVPSAQDDAMNLQLIITRAMTGRVGAVGAEV